MNEKTKDIENLRNESNEGKSSQSEFRDLVDLGAYRSLPNNEFFQGLHKEEQFDVMQNTLENCLKRRESRFYRLVNGRPDLAAEYRDQEIKTLRTAMHALDEIALVHGKEEALQQDIFEVESELDKAA
jgi:hypothetical protein